MRDSFSNLDATGTVDNHNPANATDTPKYGVFGSWACSDWITWHKALKSAYGKEVADQKWMDAWNKQGFFDTDLSWCKYNTDFNNYMTNEKLPVSWILPDVIVGAQNVAKNVVDTANSTTKTLKWLIPVVLVGVASIGLYFVYRKSRAL